MKKYLCILLVLVKVNISLQWKEMCAGPGLCLVVTPEEEKLLNKPFYIDANGVKINWTDPNDGWNLEMRLIHVKALRKMNYQRKHVPRLTKLGRFIYCVILCVIIIQVCNHRTNYYTRLSSCEMGYVITKIRLHKYTGYVVNTK